MGIKIKHFPEGVPTIHGDTAYWGVALDKRSKSYFALDLQNRPPVNDQFLALSVAARKTAKQIAMDWLYLSKNRKEIESWITSLPLHTVQFQRHRNSPVITVFMDARRLGKPDSQALLGVTDDPEVTRLLAQHLENKAQTEPRL